MHDLTRARTRKEKLKQKSVCYRKCKRLPSTEYTDCRANTHDLTRARTHRCKTKRYGDHDNHAGRYSSLRSILMILHFVSSFDDRMSIWRPTMLAKGSFAIEVASWHHNERPKYGAPRGDARADGQVILACKHPVTRRRKVKRFKRLSSIVAASCHTMGTPLTYAAACNHHVRRSTIETCKTRRLGTGSCPKFLAHTFGTLKVAQAKNARMSRKIRRFGPPRQAGFKANGDCDLPGAIDQGLGALDRTAHRRSAQRKVCNRSLRSSWCMASSALTLWV